MMSQDRNEVSNDYDGERGDALEDFVGIFYMRSGGPFRYKIPNFPLGGHADVFRFFKTVNVFTEESTREKQLKGNLFFAIFDVKKVS